MSRILKFTQSSPAPRSSEKTAEHLKEMNQLFGRINSDDFADSADVRLRFLARMVYITFLAVTNR